MVFLFLIALDQLAKHFVKKAFRNFNFAFSLPLPTWSMYFIYGVIMVLVLWYCAKNFGKFSFWQTLSWILIISGAVLNIGERIVLGFVRDFIFVFNGVFNLADCYIIAGIIILLFLNLKPQTKI